MATGVATKELFDLHTQQTTCAEFGPDGWCVPVVVYGLGWMIVQAYRWSLVRGTPR